MRYLYHETKSVPKGYKKDTKVQGSFPDLV